VVRAFLEAGIDRGVVLSPKVAWARRRLHESGGQVPVAQLVREVGWSRRHFTARFREQVGLPPKTLARVLRFERAARMGERRGSRSWADVAAACGYYDQAHLVRDFQDLAGCTPTEFERGLLPGLQSPAEPMPA
jgi:AraC-like DNA-binding protein